MPDPKHEIRMSDELWKLLGEISLDLGYDDGRGVHSIFIREMVAAAAAKWRHSPYVSRSSRHIIFVTERGALFYGINQELKLNFDRHLLPCSIEMKPEKRAYYQRSLPSGRDEADWFRDQWILNYFATYQGRGLTGQCLSQAVDRVGGDAKLADLPIHLPAGRLLTREMVIGIEDYVQWDEGSIGYDRADFPIDIPIHGLDVTVIVDEGLYKFSDMLSEEIPSLALEFRNRESALFAGKEVALSPEMDLKEVSGRAPKNRESATFGQELAVFIRRLKKLSEVTLKDGLAVNRKQKAHIDTLRVPDRFLFYSLKWKFPHLGVEACVRWRKPVKGSG